MKKEVWGARAGRTISPLSHKLSAGRGKKNTGKKKKEADHASPGNETKGPDARNMQWRGIPCEKGKVYTGKKKKITCG